MVPLLVDLSGPTQLTGPLAQFQAKTAQKAGMLSVVRSLAAVAGIDERVAAQRFEVYWPQLEEKVESAKEKAATQPASKRAKRRDDADVLDEILLHVRALRSDGETTADARRRARAKNEAALLNTLRVVLDELAAEFGLRVTKYPGPPTIGEPRPEVLLESLTEYSRETADAFERALGTIAKREGWEAPAVSVIPF